MRQQPVWYSAIVMLAVAVLLAVSGWFYTNHTQRQSDQRWCELLTIITTGPTPPPGPAGERARVVSTALAQLRDDFGC